MTSEQDSRRRIEEENERLRDLGLTQDKIDGLTQRDRDWALQMMNQVPATFLDYWKDCCLPPCRRARKCRGYLSERQYREGGHDASFPPCVGKSSPRRSEMRVTMGKIREWERPWAAEREKRQPM